MKNNRIQSKYLKKKEFSQNQLFYAINSNFVIYFKHSNLNLLVPQYFLANAEKPLLSHDLRQKYRYMNKQIKQFRANPQDAFKKVRGKSISQKQWYSKYMNTFNKIDFHRNKKMEEQTGKMKNRTRKVQTIRTLIKMAAIKNLFEYLKISLT